jgi:C-terminal processing protease CtpA/Prc
MFQTKASRLLDWGDGMVEAKPTKDAIQFPVAVLVNGQTAGAAEALAAVLRKTGAGLVLGSKTAGRAAILQPFSLKSGQRVLIAVAAVKLGDGSVLSPDGYRPDISVVVKAEDERTYYADAFADPAKTNSTDSASMVITNQVAGTNRPARKRMSEAQLVREHRDGKGESEDAQSSPEPEADKPVLRDPALLRAVDLLKGLAVVRQSRAE